MLKTLCPLLLLGATAWAQGRIPVQPFGRIVIDSPGTYVLTGSLFRTGPAPGLVVIASNVTLDLNGYEVAGPGTNMGTGVLVEGSTGVRIRNGSIRDFGSGVTVMNSNAVTIENLTITGRGLAVPAPPPEVGIMLVNSRSVVIRRNNIFGVGLGVFVRGPGSTGNHIHDNTISASTNGQLGVCYNPVPGQTGGPRGDTVERNAISGFRFAIQANAGGPNVFKDNVLFYTTGAFEIAAGAMVQDVNNTKVQLP